jgi:hypothetical protein
MMSPLFTGESGNLEPQSVDTQNPMTRIMYPAHPGRIIRGGLGHVKKFFQNGQIHSEKDAEQHAKKILSHEFSSLRPQ